ncbi:Na+/H+ antiporter NhaA [Micromonospora sp. CA-263727]|uniref:Na+/H+ antiporter NhaA n=1 Tax=Micromonospora sp. CA-263727 TaxID=3239967 RepID=UPI003D8B04D6
MLRTETVAGALLLAAAVVALVWANSPWSDSHLSLSEVRVGPATWHLDLSLAPWAADGLLAVFFFVVGLELKREFVVGELRDPRRAALPVAAAIGGMTVPATIYAVFNAGSQDGALAGWAIPTATDIAFALAVFGLINTHLPVAMRTFLLTLAVVDDLLAIGIIAIFYTSALRLDALALALVPLAIFALLVRNRVRTGWILLPFAAATWALVHTSGIHATVAGVFLAFTVPVSRQGDDAGRGPAERFERRLRPFTAGVALPIFAFFAAGVSFSAAGGLATSVTDPVFLGVATGLVVGKTAGVFGATWLMRRLAGAQLGDGVGWWDVFGLAVLAGMGFTVSLLIGELAFGAGSARNDYSKIGVLVGSLLAAILSTLVLCARNAHHRRVGTLAARTDAGGVPRLSRS